MKVNRQKRKQEAKVSPQTVDELFNLDFQRSECMVERVPVLIYFKELFPFPVVVDIGL